MRAELKSAIAPAGSLLPIRRNIMMSSSDPICEPYRTDTRSDARYIDESWGCEF